MMLRLAVLLLVVGVVHEVVFVDAIRGKCHGGNPESREDALEAIPPGENTCVSPRLAAAIVSAVCGYQG